MNQKEKELNDLENAAFDIEADFRIYQSLSYETYREQTDKLNDIINKLTIEVYGSEYVEERMCLTCGRYHVKDSYFLKTYKNRKQI